VPLSGFSCDLHLFLTPCRFGCSCEYRLVGIPAARAPYARYSIIRSVKVDKMGRERS
jgi:hypothetical protein